MVDLLGQSEVAERVQRLVFVGGLWPVFWGVVAATGLGAVLWLVIVDGVLRKRFGMGLVLKAVGCLWVGIIATGIALAGADVGGAGVVLMGLAAGALVVYLYATERRFVGRRMGLTLTALRAALIIILFAMMAEPILSLNRTETKQRWLAVLADESVSMDVVDRHATGGQRLRMADALGALSELARPIRLGPDAIELRCVARQLDPHSEWLSDVLRGRQRHEATSSTADQRRRTMHASLAGLIERVGRVAETLATILEDRQTIPRDCMADLVDLRSRLDSQALEPLEEVARQLEDRERFDALSLEQIRRLIQVHAEAVAGLTAVGDALDAASDRLDEAFAHQADAETRRAMDRAGETPRRRLVAGLLGEERGGLLSDLVDKVRMRYYLFAGKSRGMGLGQVVGQLEAEASARPPAVVDQAVATTAPATQPARTDADASTRSATDLAGALEQVARDLPTEALAGVIVLSDGQHNAPGDPVAAAQALGSQGVGVYPVIVGARQAPTDAAIVKVDVANVVHVEDTMDVSVSLRLDGLEGETLEIRLLDEQGRVLGLEDEDEQGRRIERDAPLKNKTLTVASDHERREVRLSHKPKGKGRHVYRVVLETLDQEVFKENNERVFAVDVNDERTNVLIVDGLPRWEFRYLRNLLSRDKSVRLQYVLFHPALIARQPEMTSIPARVTNASPEADRLPDTDEDLNAFDVIVLGDVSANDLPRDKQRMIGQFVSDRGGALVVVSGKRHMPAAYEGHPLAALLPVRLDANPPATTSRAAPARGDRFRLRLTTEGYQAMVTQLAVETETNRSLWSALPAMSWRSPFCVAKGAASVLAWAQREGAARGSSEHATTRRTDAEAPLGPQQTNALLVSNNYGLGKVLYIGWDATWRFRYKHGDKYHHKFWGQVLRWATMGKLPGGMKLVKIGTDKARYSEGQPVVIRAKFTRPDLTPMTDAEVRAIVRQGERTVTSVRLDYLAGSPGMYEAALNGPPRGKYTIALESPQIEALRQRDDPPGEVATAIVVEASESGERLELAANAELMAQLAEASGGLELTPAGGERLLDHIPTDPVVKRIHQQVTVWDRWWLLLLFAAVVGAEWILRKRAGLM